MMLFWMKEAADWWQWAIDEYLSWAEMWGDLAEEWEKADDARIW